MYTAEVNTINGSDTTMVRITVSADAGEDTALFVVSKKTESSNSSTNDNLVFESVASISDVLTLGTTEVYPDKYRVSEIVLYFLTQQDEELVTTEILNDIQTIFNNKEFYTIELDTEYQYSAVDTNNTDEDLEFKFFKQ